MASKRKTKLFSEPRVQSTRCETNQDSTVEETEIDWSKCIFCQSVIEGEKLRSPGATSRSNAGSGYETFTALLVEFQKIDRRIAIQS